MSFIFRYFAIYVNILFFEVSAVFDMLFETVLRNKVEKVILLTFERRYTSSAIEDILLRQSKYIFSEKRGLSSHKIIISHDATTDMNSAYILNDV